MAKNKLTDMNDHLFAQLERLNDEDLTPDQIEAETKRAKAMTSISSQIIQSHKVTIEAMKLVAKGDVRLNDFPATLGLNKDNSQSA